MASKNLQRAYAIHKLLEAKGDKKPSQNDIVFLRKFIKKHRAELENYIQLQKAKERVAQTDVSAVRNVMDKKQEYRVSQPKPKSNEPEGSLETQKTGQLIKQNTRAIRINNAAWRGIDAAIKDGAIDGTKVRLLEKQGKQKEAYELGVKLVRDYLKDANKILGDGEKLQVDGIYGRKSKAAFAKYNEYKQAFAGDDQSNNPLLKEGTTGDRFQRRLAFSYDPNNVGDETSDSLRMSPDFLKGLPIDSTARFNRDNAYIIPDYGRDPKLIDSVVYTPRGQFINYTAGILRMPNDSTESRHPIVIGNESYEPYLNQRYVGRRGNTLYSPIYQNDKVRNDTIGILGGTHDTGFFDIYPVDTIPGVYTDELGGSGSAYAFYNSSPIFNKEDSSFVYLDNLLAHPEWLDSIRASANVPLDIIRPIYINAQKKGGLLKKRCKK